MRTILGPKRNFLAVAVLLTLALPAAWAKGIDDFKLTKAIPADAFFAVHCRDHAGKEFINQQYARVWAEVERQRFDRDLKGIFRAIQQKNLPEGAELEGFDEQWQQITDLFTSVEWGSLGKRECAMGMKLGFPTVEFVALMMPPEDKVKENFAGLSGILKTVVAFDPNALTLTTEEDGDTVIHKVSLADAPFPLGFALGRHNDVIIIAFGPTMIEQSLALLRGEGGQTLASTARFQEAFGKLPPPSDKLVFVDLAKLFGQVRGLVNQVTAMMEGSGPAEGEPGYDAFVKWKALPPKIVDMFDMWEYVAEVRTTDGMVATADAITVLRDDAASHGFYPVFYGNNPLHDPLKYVPKNAGEFWVTSGINLPALYEVAVEFIRAEIPDGEEIIAKLESLKQPPAGVSMRRQVVGDGKYVDLPVEGESGGGMGLDIEKDVVGWIGGSLATFSIPGPTAYASSEFVMMLSVRDEAKAREMIERLLALLEPMLQSGQGSIVDAEIEGAEGFKSVIFPPLAMVGIDKPTLGVKDGWLFFASSPSIIGKSLEVAAGNAENFSTNERFVKEGIPAEGHVTSLSFTDQTKLGEELGQVLMMVPMIGMMVPDLAKDRVVQKMLSMAGKVGRVVRKLDFFQSSASRTTFENKIERTKRVTTYREPPVITKPKPMDTETEGESETEEPRTPEEE